MNSFWRLLTRLKNYRLNVILSVVSNILMAVFTIISIPLLQPFLEILFEQTEAVNERPEWRLDLSSIVQSAKFYLSQ
jgi:ABC-type multidrug transport system fused ATPase/permease subunit